MIIKRRTVLKHFFAGAVGTTLWGLGRRSLVRPSWAQSTSTAGKTLVVVFQRGGCDGLNTCIPFGDSNYYNLRPTIAIAEPDANNPESAVDLDGFFGLHPGLAPLHDLYVAGNLALFPTVHYPQPSRSHFNSQDFIESGATERLQDGWLNRYLQTAAAHERALSFGNHVAYALHGAEPVSAIRDVRDFQVNIPNIDQDSLRTALAGVYDQASDGRAYRESVSAMGTRLLDDLDSVANIDLDDYPPENGAEYPNRSFGRDLQQTAQLIKARAGLELVTIDIGGWDTHRGQGAGSPDGYQRKLHNLLAQGIRAFCTDLGAFRTDTEDVPMNDVLLLVCTEFGRTAHENGSGGTDHGHASTWFAASGNRMNGSGIYGDWPGLGPDQLSSGRFLQYTIDYRDLLAEIVSRFLQQGDLATIFPGHTTTPVNFLLDG